MLLVTMEIEMEETFGQHLARVRKQRGFSQVALAEKIGVTARVLCYYERETKRPPAHLLPKIAAALDLSLDELLGTKDVHLDGRSVDAKLLRKLEKLKDLPAEDRRLVVQMIDSLAAKNSAAQ